MPSPELPGVPHPGTDTPLTEPQLLELAPDLTVWIGAERDARLIYKEIYQDRLYDIARLPPKPFLIDAGANIGLFTLYMKTRYPDAHVLAFEPVPQILDLLRRNLALHGIPEQDVDTYAVALGAESMASKTLTYFPNAPGNSTFVPEEKELLRKALPEAHYQRMIDRSSAGATPVDVPLERLSRVLDGYPDLKRIDLLKVDVESWELDVLRGLDDRHWKMVRHAAIEVSELSGLCEDIEALLKEKGFSVDRQSASWSLKSAPVYTLIAKRGEGTSSTL